MGKLMGLLMVSIGVGTIYGGVMTGAPVLILAGCFSCLGGTIPFWRGGP